MSNVSEPRERPHPGPLTYLKVALVLGALTAIEVAAFYVPAPQGVRVAFFLLFTGVEFSIVAMFYMHLRYDRRIFAGLFLAGILVATAIIAALLALYGVIG
ncbi:MAG: cytochrome C oxidase subunit IV family protein [Chloroflexota bacterium]